MKQRWLINPLPVNELSPTFELNSPARDELITLMATAIEHVCLQQTNLHQQTHGVPTDELTTTSQDHCGAPEPQSDCLPEAIITETSRSESRKPAAAVCDGRKSQATGLHTSRDN
jgi:hypothetical protein